MSLASLYRPSRPMCLVTVPAGEPLEEPVSGGQGVVQTAQVTDLLTSD